jgi:catechol-2,3-dioxygenase
LYAGEHAVLHLSESRDDEERLLSVATTFDHVAFACTDLAGYEDKLRQAGIPYRVAQVPLTGQVQLFLHDPAGNGVELDFAVG